MDFTERWNHDMKHGEYNNIMTSIDVMGFNQET